MYERIIATVLAHPWAILDVKFDAIVSVLAMRAAGERFTEDEIRERVGERKELPVPYLVALGDGKTSLAIAGGDFAAAADRLAAKAGTAAGGTRMIAVIPVHGIIMPRAADFEMSTQGVSIEQIRAQFRQALNSPDISAIVLDFDSPGGSVFHVDEMASEIFDARGRKKVIAQIDPLAASAAYYLAAQASEVVMTPSGQTGSIGVRAMHQDISRALEMKGIKVTQISFGKYKTEGSPFGPLSEEGYNHSKALVDAYGNDFVHAVARGRGVSAARVEKDFGQGRVYGVAEAKQRGMIDRVATLDETLARLGAGAGGARAATLAAGADVPAFAVAAIDLTGPDVFPGAIILHSDLQVSAGVVPGEVSSVSIPATAEKQSEVKMSTIVTPAAAAANPAIVAEAARVEALQSLAAVHPMKCGASQLNAWLADGTSVADANAIIMRRYAAAAKPLPAPAAEVLDALGGAREKTDRNGPFKSFGEQLIAITASSRAGGRIDERLNKVMEIQAAASGASEGTPSDGGFAVQTDFSDVLLQKAYDTGILARKVFRLSLGANSNGIKLPAVDETSRVTGSRWGGVQVYWANEADTVTAKKPKYRRLQLELKKLLGLMYVTDELIQDASLLQALAERAMGEEFGFVIDDAILNGTGAGQPLGINNSGALVAVAKDASQTATTFTVGNALAMYARMPARLLAGAEWFFNQDVLPWLPKMVIGQQPVFMPPLGIAGSPPFGSLLGRPINVIEQAETVGAQGDAIFANFGEYLMIDKGNTQFVPSIHVRFIYDEMTFRWTYRVDGQPGWAVSLTPFKGSNNLSPFIECAIRA